MTQPFAGAILGRRGSGKTTLLIDQLLTFWKHRFSMIVVLSRTLHLQNEVWRRLGGKGVLLVPRLDQELLTKLKAFMSSRRGQGEVLVVMDDLGSEARFWSKAIQRKGQNDEITSLAFTSRHFDISLVFLAQEWVQLPVGYRKQLDWVMVLSASQLDQRYLFMELTTDPFHGDLDKFQTFHDQNTGDYRFYTIYNQGGRIFVTAPEKKEEIKEKTTQ